MINMKDDFSVNTIGTVWDDMSTRLSSAVISDGELKVSQFSTPHSAGLIQTKQTIPLDNFKKYVKVEMLIKLTGSGRQHSDNCLPMLGFVSKNAIRETDYYQTANEKNLVLHFEINNTISLVQMGGFTKKNVIQNSGIYKYVKDEYFKLIILIEDSNIKIFINSDVVIDYNLTENNYNELSDDNISFEICVPGYASTSNITLDEIMIETQRVIFIPKINMGYLSLSTLNVFKDSTQQITLQDFELHGSNIISDVTEILSKLAYKDKFKLCVIKLK